MREGLRRNILDGQWNGERGEEGRGEEGGEGGEGFLPYGCEEIAFW